jgi:hypothetical protein
MKASETRKRNRHHTRRPRPGRAWCGGCDTTLVAFGRRCAYCGWKSPEYRHSEKVGAR